jgi:hypothetical protein
VIQDYVKGKINVSSFRQSLNEYNVTVDAPLDRLIRRHEVGDFVTYNELGQQIYRQLNGTE